MGRRRHAKGSKDPPFAVGRSAAFEGLKPTKICELDLEKCHSGRVLYGRLSAKASNHLAILTALEDDTGNEVLVSIHDAVTVMLATSQEALDALFPIGMNVGIKEPLYETSSDGKILVRVDDPSTFVISNSGENDEGPKWGVAESLEALESYRKLGNKFFQREDWELALGIYLRCAIQGNDVGIRVQKSGAEDGIVTKCKNFMLLTFSNMAEAELRLGRFEDALSDVERGLKIDPTHVKSLNRQGRAAMELGLYKKASAAFTAVLEQCPDEASARQNLRLCAEHLV